MSLPRLLTLIATVCLALGLIIGLVSSLTGLYTQVAWSASPLLANLLIFAILVLLGTLIFAIFYYLKLLQSPPKAKGRRAIKPKIPVVKSEAASENLKAIRQQVDRIQIFRSSFTFNNRNLRLNSSFSFGFWGALQQFKIVKNSKN